VEELKLADIPVTFVYIGDRIPSYALHSLQMARKYSGQEILLLANRSAIARIKELDFPVVEIESFYNPLNFQSIQKKLVGDAKFRNSLWLRSLERFFVLEQYLSWAEKSEVFHAESDQFLFNTSKLVTNLRRTGVNGTFFPVHSQDAVVASVMYCNNLSALRAFLQFAKNASSFSSEMELLAQWARSELDHNFVELPATHHFILGNMLPVFPNTRLIPPNELQGVVDPAELGQWFMGIDPRNVPFTQRPMNKFVGPESNTNLSRFDLSGISVALESDSNSLMLKLIDGRTLQIFNLHNHSKIHTKEFLDEGYFQDFLEIINDPHKHSFSGTRTAQVIDILKSYTYLIIRRVTRWLKKNEIS
jgi:hypothetical protein